MRQRRASQQAEISKRWEQKFQRADPKAAQARNSEKSQAYTKRQKAKRVHYYALYNYNGDYKASLTQHFKAKSHIAKAAVAAAQSSS